MKAQEKTDQVMEIPALWGFLDSNYCFKNHALKQVFKIMPKIIKIKDDLLKKEKDVYLRQIWARLDYPEDL